MPCKIECWIDSAVRNEHFRRDLRILSALSILVWQNAVNDSELGGYVED